MLNVGSLNEGIVLDHIKAGKSMSIYKYLQLDKLDCQVAIIKNARSEKMGRKDIIKIEGSLDLVDLDILGCIDHDITVNIIQNGEIMEKKDLTLPRTIKNIFVCKNPRCITSEEKTLDQIFFLSDSEKEVYRCKYCEERYTPNFFSTLS
ncbi:MAG: aspartate carbamoyltransferase regulatory subunit [Lachnospiraceae bacterium]|nr:aspartate carbamoyltransferase regulatory subunit [Lachnospiraceae bacterium]